MKSLVKIVVGLVVLLVVLFGGAALYLTAFFNPNDYKDTITAEASKALGREVKLNGPITLHVFPNLSLALSDVTLGKAPNGKESDITMRELSTRVALMPLLNKQVEIESLVVRDAALSISDKGKKTQLEIAELTTAVQPARPLALTATGKVNGAPLTLSLKGDTIEKLQANTADYPVEGNVKLGGSTINFTGTVNKPTTFAGADLKINASGNGKDLAAMTGSPLPFAGYQADAQLSMPNAQSAKLSGLKFSTGQTAVTGDLVIALGPKPNVTGALDILKLFMADFAQNQPVQKQGWLISSAHAANGQPMIPAVPLPADALRAMNANIKLNIGDIIGADGKSMAAMDGTAVINNALLTLSPMQLKYAGNTFVGKVNLDGSGAVPVLAANLQSDALDYGLLFKEMKLNDRIRGIGKLVLNISGRGADLRQVMASSAGTFTLSSDNGEFDTGMLFDGIGNVLKMALPNTTLPDVAKLQCAALSFTGQNGIWHTEQSAVNTDVLAMQLAGDVNLAEEKVTMKAFTNLKSAKMAGLIPPIKIAGALGAPAVIVDGAGLAQSAVTAAVLGKSKGVDLLRGFGASKENAATAPAVSGGGSCLQSVQKVSASQQPTQSTGEQAKGALDKYVAPEKQEKLKEQLNKGLQGLFGK